MHTPSRINPPSPTRGNRTRTLHKLTGLGLALPVVLLVITGLPLEFASELNLGSRGVPFGWVHSAYGIEPPRTATVDNGIVTVGEVLILDERTVEGVSRLLAGSSLSDFTMVLTVDEWLLIPTDGQISVDRGRYPGQVKADRAAFAAGLPVIQTADGVFTSTDYGASWHTMSAPVHNWHTPLTPATTPEWELTYGAAIVSWERWLQDLHSGRFFGTIGRWIMSVAGFALIFLALTGFLIWFRSLRRR